MGPALNARDRPSYPKFSWDLRNCPWTDGRGNQEPYASAVEMWSSYHDTLPDTNSNKIPKNLRGLTLRAQLYDRAFDLCRSIPKEELLSDNGAEKIVSVLYKRDPLSAVSHLYDDFSSLLETRRGKNESFKNFESRFSAQIAKYNAHGQSIELPESIVALLLLNNANVGDSQRVPILSAASAKASTAVTAVTSNDDMIKLIEYEAIAAVIRQCDNGSNSSSHQTESNSYVLSGNYVNPNSSVKNSSNLNPKKKRTMNAEQLRLYKLRNRCNQCQKYGHFKSDHNADGSIKNGLPSNNAPINNYNNRNNNNCTNNNQNTNNNRNSSNNNAVLNFNASLISVQSSSASNFTSSSLSSNVINHSSPVSLGPLVDGGAPYSAIGVTELCVLRSSLGLPTLTSFDPIPKSFANYKYWQYGGGSHCSEKREILGSVLLCCRSDLSRPINIRHLVIAGSSQWLIGRNVTSLCNQLRIGDSRIQFPKYDGIQDYLSIIESETHDFVSLDRFVNVPSAPSTENRSVAVLAGNSISVTDTAHPSCQGRSISDLTRIVNRVHEHVCGHATYGDMRTLLQRNQLWNDDVQKLLASLVERCSNCIASAPPPSTRKVSIAGINRNFNDVVYVDHFWLDDQCLFHIMDSYSRFSAVQTVDSTALADAIVAFENNWIGNFWPPGAVQGDLAFRFNEFISFLKQYDIEFRPVPPRRHHKNLLEPKHGVIRAIFLRLKNASPTSNTKLLAVTACRISNEMYGSDTLSSFEIAKGYSKPLDNSFLPRSTPDELLKAHDELKSKRKLTLILRSNATRNPSINAGDLVQVYIRKEKEKRGRWSSPRTVLSHDKESGIVSVPGLSGRPITAAVEDVRLAVVDDELAVHISETNDKLADIIDTEIDTSLNDDGVSMSSDMSNNPTFSPDFDHDGNFIACPPDLTSSSTPNIGDRVEVFWPIDDKYYSGVVGDITHDGKFVVNYDDGDSETLNMADEQWRPCDSVNAHSVSLPRLKSEQSTVIREMYESIGNKPFLLHHAQGFPQHVIYNSYDTEEIEFKKHVNCVPIADVPPDANIISSHTVYKIKIDEDNTFRLKARIAPHGNEDSMKLEMKSDCSMCAPVGIRIVLIISVIRRWIIVKADVKAAFLKTGRATRDVYVRPPRESKDRRHYWLLLAAAYGLVNANAKFQTQADELILNIGLSCLTVIPQLFYLIRDGNLVLVVAKIVDDLIFTGENNVVDDFIQKFDAKFKFGTVLRGPGFLKFYGMSIEQYDDMSVSIHADDKLGAIECFPLSRIRRRQIDSPVSDIEKSSFMSVNSSLGWLGISASPLCAFYASHLQQKMPSLTVNSVKSQANYLKLLKSFGTLIKFPSLPSSGSAPVSVLVFSDAGRMNDYGQLSFYAGLLVGPFQQDSIFYTLSWMSHKSKRPIKSIGAAEILAASEAIDEGKVLKSALSTLLGIDIPLIIALDSRDLFTSLSTQRNSVDKSIRADVNCIRYEFETENVNEIIWIPGRVNLSDPGTKPNSPLTQAMLLTLANGKLSIDLSNSESRKSNRPLG